LRNHQTVSPIINMSHLPAVSVAIVREGRVLLVRRGRDPSRGVYAFPGGRVEPEETLEAAARRELMEETSLSAGRLEPYRTVLIEPAAEGAPAFELTVFAGNSAEGVLHAGDDADAAGWFSIEEMEKLPLLESVAAIARELLTGS
jgi:8-oxo-dGTP diphosphatase